MENFTLLKNEDIEKAYSTICWRAYYLKSKGIYQYNEPYPSLEVFRERQMKGFNYGLYVHDNLAVMVSLIPGYIPHCWAGEFTDSNFFWLTSLFSTKEFMGQKLGSLALKKVEMFSKSKNIKSLYLDCFINNEDFLVSYYKKAGYEEITKKIIIYPAHNFHAALMRKNLL